MSKDSKSRAIENLIKAIKGDTDIKRIISSSSITKSLNDLVDYIKENGVGGSGKCEGVEVYANLKSGDSDNSKTLQDIFKVLKPLTVSGNKFTVYIPEGTYYFNYPLSPYSNISIRGAGIGKTILKTRGTGSGYSLFQNVKDTDDKLIENVVYSDMTIDGSEFEFNGTYNSNAKGIFFTNVKNSIFERLEFVGTGSTALGIDFLENVFIDKVICENCGRLWTMLDGVEGPGGAGIGIGTGARESENFIISNCICIGCGHYGIFIEHQFIFDGKFNKDAKGSLINNCVVKDGRFNGIGIRGGQNIQISNCTSYNNENYGIYADCGEDSTLYLSLKNIKINDNIVTDNENGIGLAGNAWLDGMSITNNMIGNNSNIGLDIGNTKAESSVVVNQRYLKISGNNIYSNKYPLFVNDVANLEGLDIDNTNTFNNNTNNCGSLNFANSNSYGEFITNPIPLNVDTIKFDIKAPTTLKDLTLLSCKDDNYTTDINAKGWAIRLLVDGSIAVIGISESGNTNKIFKNVFKTNLEADTNYKFSIKITDSAVNLWLYNEDGSYEIYTRDTSNSLGTETSLVWIIRQNIYVAGNVQLGREFLGSNGYGNYATGLILYELLTYSEADDRQVIYFTNVGKGKKVESDRGAIALLHNGAEQKCNKL